MDDTGALFFVIMAGLAGMMALVYVPLRLLLTATAGCAEAVLSAYSWQ